MGEREFIVEFIRVYKNLPALWNSKCKEYYNEKEKNNACEVLVKKFREKHEFAGRRTVMKTINSLRCNFSKELKLIEDSNKNDVVETKIWYFLEEMMFLYDEETCKVTNVLRDEELDFEDTDRGSEIPVDSLLDSQESTSDLKIKTNENQQLTCSASPKTNDNEYDKIANYWTLELQQMSSQQQLFAKKAINDILFEGQLGTLHRESVQINLCSKISTPPNRTQSFSTIVKCEDGREDEKTKCVKCCKKKKIKKY